MTDLSYVADLHETIQISSGKYLILLCATGRRFVLSAFQAKLLESCRRSATLDDHFNRIKNEPFANQHTSAALRDAITDFVSRGLLVDVNAFIRQPFESSERRTITSLGLVTADRPALLQRALGSYGQHLLNHGKTVHVIVMDDSRSSGARNQNRLVLSRSGGASRYCGLEDKESYIEHLARCGIDPAVARFALLGSREGLCTIGANRNCLLLDTLGELIFTADDDTLCQFVWHPQRSAELRFISHTDPRDMWFYNSRAELLEQTARGDANLFAEHERILGSQVATLLSEAPLNSLIIDGACNHTMRSLYQGNSTIRATLSGIIGDSGAFSSLGLLMSVGTVNRKLASAEALFRTAFRSREVLWVAPCASVSHFMLCQSTAMGLANIDLLPPFLPVGRNEDGVFGALLYSTHPTSFVGHVPLAILHDPPTQRTYENQLSFRLADLFICLTLFFARDTTLDSRGLLRKLGQDLLVLAQSSHVELWNVILAAVARRRSEMLRWMYLVVKTWGSPAYWQKEVTRIEEETLEELGGDHFCVPLELKHTLPIETARATTISLLGEWGSFVSAWPDIVDAARYLQGKGVRLSNPARSSH